jgi:glycerophosphoryl diester phosphodiesterase
VLRIGHKGADAIRPGNTVASFEAAVEAGVDVIELDVCRPQGDFAAGEDWREAAAGPARASGPLLVAHDWSDARRRTPLTLDQALDAFMRPPLDGVRIDLDLKLAGREDEVAVAIRERDLGQRAMVSTMEVASLAYLRDHAPEIDRGWTLPKVSRDWTRSRWGRPIVLAGSLSLKARLPGLIRRRAPELGVWAIWLYHPLATPRIVAAADTAGVALIAWTVDDPARIEALRAMGVSGICTNDPRLLVG